MKGGSEDSPREEGESSEEVRSILARPFKAIHDFFKILGPGIVTGVADDDPSGIGTYSATGAAFGTKLLWMAPYLLPMVAAVQETCARIGIVTREGMSANLQKKYAKWVIVTSVFTLLVANIVNIGADIQAMSACMRLLVPIPFVVAALTLTVVIIVLEVFIPYKQYSRYLKYLTISVFGYVIAGFMVHADWSHILSHALVPSVSLNKEYIFAMIAIFGTTISPYLFFWQTSQEVEQAELEDNEAEPGKEVRPRARIQSMRKDVFTGMFVATLVMFFIMLTTAETLHKHAITNIQTPQQAALALRPLAGHYASLLFTIGIIATGLLAVPVLAGSGAYALAEIFKWREGLAKKVTHARGYYAVIIASIGLGLLLNFSGISPMKALYYAAFLNGIVAVPLLFLILRLGDDKRVMGAKTNPRWVKIFGWAAFISATAAIVATVVLYLAPVH